MANTFTTYPSGSRTLGLSSVWLTLGLHSLICLTALQKPTRTKPSSSPGGHDSEWRILRSVEIYDPRRDSWTAGPSLPQGVSFAGCAASPGHQVSRAGADVTSCVCAGLVRARTWPTTLGPLHHGRGRSANIQKCTICHAPAGTGDTRCCLTKHMHVDVSA